MKIAFRTKEESNNQQREEFIKLAPAKRVEKFLEMMEAFRMFPVNERIEKKKKGRGQNNFIIEIQRK